MRIVGTDTKKIQQKTKNYDDHIDDPDKDDDNDDNVKHSLWKAVCGKVEV